ncbi:FAD linked oxidase domain protein [Kribbella flavida DSM 17836]|uniref:Delta(24)-sterol reductase n=1 Tax=Kribbella flavida (strain DSM 17836 / JCM 10339 / NBRC 14399) TaxID=479435 RepID=D2Q0W1_KRIFD|nr:FAD-binding oxidoreductase [Kribbella flavida]ADB33911.1 FAD linked oxidase domain protein [Kribbella flavida DSM 17836]
MEHDRAVGRLRASYQRIPPGAPVRLAKRSSNLFRPRAAVETPGLDVSGLTGVVAVDPDARTADVQGMCTYEDLVAATLPYGLVPMVVPQLKTITLGGAVTGLGIESSSFRAGLPHESVLELDILTGAGEIVTARPAGEHADLFRTFPNSYGTLGYATRLRIELDRISPYVALRHVRLGLEELAPAIDEIVATGTYAGEPVHFVDGVAFSPTEAYLTLGRNSDAAVQTSDYTGQQIYYRSIQQRPTDFLTAHDYLWRWDTDWFWCSAAFGAQNRWVRRLWPSRWRRSDVYHKIIGLENRHQVAARINRRRGLPDRERVVQDVEIPAAQLAGFLRWFDAEVGMRPVWLCPLRLRGDEPWPLYPLAPGTTYVNVGFWGTVPIAAGAADGDVNRRIEAAVADFGGHKSLYSDAYYDRDTFDRLYNVPALTEVKKRYDPDARLTGLYEKAVTRR